ncbi:hypothetical protein ACIODX_38020 [Streptomyces sp. NPDC088190]|uniref:hypothetical protein n=1 Tax=unclassified Streptomyces TaxID=2593676 RepID=UPI002E75C335|nr:hypothetical protein [Streptomyces sp. JV190]MEE1838394.1 hypothetical protein [Streptomyces sp. JV190]
MNWTTALAVFGASTGAVGVAWQFWSHWLTGGRVQVLALRERQDERWAISTSVINVGRQDVTVAGYTVWLDRDGMRGRRLRWKIQMLRRFGLAHVRRSLVTLPPSLSFAGEAWLRDDRGSVQFPTALPAGATLRMPHTMLDWSSNKPCRPRVAVHLGSGKFVQADVLSAEAFEPMDIDASYRIDADFEVDVRSDEMVQDANGAVGGPIRVSTSVRNRGADQVHVSTHVEPSGPA